MERGGNRKRAVIQRFDATRVFHLQKNQPRFPIIVPFPSHTSPIKRPPPLGANGIRVKEINELPRLIFHLAFHWETLRQGTPAPFVFSQVFRFIYNNDIFNYILIII